jgi:hypothetical protein
MEEGPFVILTFDLEQAALLNAALAQYWIHVRRNPELQSLLPQVADLQRLLVEKVRAIHKGEETYEQH